MPNEIDKDAWSLIVKDMQDKMFRRLKRYHKEEKESVEQVQELLKEIWMIARSLNMIARSRVKDFGKQMLEDAELMKNIF